MSAPRDFKENEEKLIRSQRNEGMRLIAQKNFEELFNQISTFLPQTKAIILNEAVKGERPEVIDLLLRNGFDANGHYEGYYGSVRDVLHPLFQTTRPDIMKVLLNHGANIGARGEFVGHGGKVEYAFLDYMNLHLKGAKNPTLYDPNQADYVSQLKQSIELIKTYLAMRDKKEKYDQICGGIQNPIEKMKQLFEAYAIEKTPGKYSLFKRDPAIDIIHQWHEKKFEDPQQAYRALKEVLPEKLSKPLLRRMAYVEQFILSPLPQRELDMKKDTDRDYSPGDRKG